MKMIYYDFRRLEAFRVIPIAVVCILSLLSMRSTAEEIVILKSMELFLTPLVTWWIVPCFFNYVNEDTREAYLSYPYSRYALGIFRILFWSFIYYVLLLAAFLVRAGRQEGYGLYFLIFMVQVMFYACFSFFLIIYTRNIVLSFGVIWGYVGVQVLDANHRFSGMSVCFYEIFYEGLQAIAMKGIIILVFSMFFMLYAQMRFNRMEVG